MLGSNEGLNLRFEAIRLTEIIRMNNIVVYCTVMLGYLEYKIQLGKKEKTKQQQQQQQQKTVKVI